MRLIVSLLALSLALPVLAQDAEKEIQVLYKAKKWTQVLERADAGPATAETEFWASRALRNLKRSQSARERYLRLVETYPGHPRAADASIEAALMLIVHLDQVAHGKAERRIAAQAARELETVAATKGLPVTSVARASYIAGNTWRMAERDELAEKAYLRVRNSGVASYAAKALEKQGELAFRQLDVERATALWRECAKKHGGTSSGRRAQRALTRLAVIGKPAPDFEVELWAQGEPVGREDLIGHVTLVFAFAVWCPHCQRELPHAADLIEDYGKRGFQVVGITKNGSQQTTAEVFPFIADKQYRMSYPVAVDQETSTTDAWSLTGLPSAALVDREGVVRWVGHPNFLSRGTIETLLAEKPGKKS